MSSLSRRSLLTSGGVAALGLATAAGVRGATHDHHGAHDHSAAAMSHGGGVDGPTFRDGRTVDHAANGFDPTEILRDFDYGRTRRTATGRVVREWEIVAEDKEIEVAPGVKYEAWTYNGRVLREWDVFAADHDIEVAPGVTFAAWTFNGRIPGPTLRCREGELLRIHFRNGSHHPHTMHFHGIHPADMDGVPGQGAGVIEPGATTTYEFEAEPFGLHLYHCHVGPLAEHIARGMYGTFIVDPVDGRPDADELVMVQHGYNTTFDGEGNQLYAVNGIPFCYMNAPVRVRRGELVRIYLSNVLEYDPINSFHLHGNFFHYFPTGTSLHPLEYTDTIAQVQGQRGILELRFPHTGPFMFHAHKTEFAELGWMGMFEVVE